MQRRLSRVKAKPNRQSLQKRMLALAFAVRMASESRSSIRPMRLGSTVLATDASNAGWPPFSPWRSPVARIPTNMKSKFAISLFSLFGLLPIPTGTAGVASPSSPPRSLYAVNEDPNDRGSISVYDIEAKHRLVKTITIVPNVGDVRGVAASAVTGKLYVAYRDASGTGMVYCLNVYNDEILWNRAVSRGVDRRAKQESG
jgi:hypothetical protein